MEISWPQSIFFVSMKTAIGKWRNAENASAG